MSEREWLFRVSDMLKEIDRIKKFISGIGFEEFSGDDKTYYAVIHSLMIIGEASKFIPAKICDEYRHIPWRDISDMRNKITHDYAGILPEIVWKVTQEDLEELEGCLLLIQTEYQ